MNGRPVGAGFAIMLLAAVAWLAVWLTPRRDEQPVDHLTPYS
jgi:hypothetical protein